MVGVADSKKLMEDIPNKVRDILGIIVNVNLLNENGKDYIEIEVSSSSYPVNYKGEYHYRSGSTKQLLKGTVLMEFLLSKTGYKWDAVPVDGVSVKDLDRESFDIFRREALRSGRMSKKDLDMTDEELLDNLGLLDAGKLKRVAVLLFHRKPEKWFTGAFIKIGMFGEGSDLQFQDEIHGSLFIQADRVIELIYLKYLKYLKESISYDKEIRIETWPFPREGIREAVYNAIIHCNRAAHIPVQIRIEEDAMYISNDCVFSQCWTAETLMERHRSEPYNPDIANAFFRAGYVETWGRGIQKICEACKDNGNPMPEYKLHPRDIMVKFAALNIPKHQNDVLDDVLGDALESRIILRLEQNNKIKQSDLAEYLAVSLPSVQKAMKKLIMQGRIERKGGKRFGYWGN